MDHIAPMLRRLGYDPNANPPNYGEADLKIKENTYHIQVAFKFFYQILKIFLKLYFLNK